MAEKAKITLEFDGKNVQVLDQANQKLKTIDNTGKKASINLRAGFVAVTAALAGLAVLIKKSTDAFGEQEKNVATLNQALKNTGNFSAAASRDLRNYASSLQNITMYGDETIIGAQALIASFGFEGETLKKLTKATLDLAAAKGMDLKAAADLVSKSVGSTTNALTRYGIVVEGAAGSTERAENAIQNISVLFGGQAEAQANTYTGTITQLQNKFGDLMEVIGAEFQPVIRDVARWLIDHMDEAAEAVRRIGYGIRFVIGIFKSFGTVVSGFSTLFSDSFEFIKERFLDFFNIFKSAGEAIGLFFTGRFRESIDVAKNAFSGFVVKSKGDWDKYKSNVAANLAAVRSEIVKNTSTVATQSVQQTAIVSQNSKAQLQHWSDVFRQRAGLAELSSDQQIAADQAIGQAATNLTSLMQSENEDAFKVGKAAAIATTIVQTYQAAQAAFTSLAGIPFVGPVLATVAAGAAIAAGLMRVSQIKAQQMPKAEFGGLVPGSPQGTPVIVGERNKSEIIQPLDEATRAAVGLGGGGTTYNINIYGTIVADAGWPKRLVQDFDRELENLRLDRGSSFAFGLEAALG